jgi:hypothetical protein
MLYFYPVKIDRELDRDHPLFVGNFYSLKGMWWSNRKKRQGLIISIAVAWYRLVRDNKTAPGFIEEETFITHLTKQLRDVRKVLDFFFTVTKIGYNFDNGSKGPSVITPKKLSNYYFLAIENLLAEIRFDPGNEPLETDLIKSSVTVRGNSGLLKELALKKRDDLIPPVAWLLKQKEVNFYFKASGKLKARDTSVWPIRAIETWPSWLRDSLFGQSIDLEAAYLQFVILNLKKKYADNPDDLSKQYASLLDLHDNKLEFRERLRKLIKLPDTHEGKKTVKKIIMSLANGSNISAALMTCQASRSEVARIIHLANPDLTPLEQISIGNELSTIAKQFKRARKELCTFLLKSSATRKNQKLIFHKYLAWERDARYQIWQAIGKNGLHLHDAIEGLSISNPLATAQLIQEKTKLKVSISTALEST